MKTNFEIANIIDRWGNDFIDKHKPNSYQQKVLRDLLQCRTAALGGHQEQCDSCDKKRYAYNSCGNRHCPKCQSVKQTFWIDDIINKALPVKHYHIIFTLPHELNEIAMMDSRWFYNIMFKNTWDTIRSFGYTHYGVETGAIMALHTWGQNLMFHPHLHCIVPAAGQTPAGNFKHICASGKFIFPVTAMSMAFQGKMLDGIKRFLIKQNCYSTYKHLVNQAWKKKWNVHCEPALASPKHIIQYLGQYINRVAISNNRIINIDQNNVSFQMKDYRDNDKIKPIQLNGVEFLRRFCLHILPKRFVKIRYYGIYSSRAKPIITKNKKKKNQEKENTLNRIKRLTGIDICKCPFCKIGTMKIVDVLPPIRAPSYINVFAKYKIN